MSNEVVFISGASSGFGLECARVLALEGYKIIALARRKDRLEDLKAEFKDQIYTISCDIRNKYEIFKSISEIPDDFKNIEILINSAGLALGQDGFNNTDVEDLEVVIDTNIKGLIYLTKAVLPTMIKRNSGYIINFGSVAGVWPYEGSHVYGASKAFVKQFSYNLRNDLKGSNIRVSEIAPGIAKTEFSLVRFKGDKKKSDAVYEGVDYIKASDIAQIVLDCIKLPKRVNINSIEVMATTQTWAGFFIEK